MPNIILPNLAPLDAAKKKRLIDIADTYTRSHFNNVLHYLQTGEITIEEMPLLNKVPDLKMKLQSSYDNWLNAPDPKEMEDWNDVSSQIPDALHLVPEVESARLSGLLEVYIDKYTKPGSPKRNHVEEARSLLRQLAAAFVKREWDEVDQLDYGSLIGFYNKHRSNIPDSMLKQLDDALWSLVYSDVRHVNVDKVAQFLKDFPVSPNHLAEAKKIASSVSDWEDVKKSNDVYKVNEYLKSHPDSPFREQAENLLYVLGKQYLEDFKKDMGIKTLVDYRRELSKGVFSEQDFIDAGIVTKKVLNTLGRIERNELSTIPTYTNIEKSHIQCPSGKTDVYFFGVPETGKTSVIMGMLNSKLLNWDAVLYSGNAGGILQNLCHEGYPASRTFGNLVSLITGNILEDKGEVQYPVNLIDMSGEDFAYRLADNPEAQVSFADMGKGVPELLGNPNDKVFLFHFDPTKEAIMLRREVEDGNFIRRELSQILIFQKFCSILENAENSEIMKKVKAIHFIATKADLLSPDRNQRLEIAKQRCQELYGHSINKLIGLCHRKKYNINPTTDNKPMVFTFSLGQFYMNNAFEYDSTDADSLLRTLASITSGRATHESLWKKFADWLNR